ncbi:MAG: hypothetical protein N838_22715 [Thiohalocapsa sp. PB-PSB1]|jgi:hypothetical protein|nr:MAG: hypothetical protein N838_22715 [Thiohalocapsa sp. PB-PSB1]
MLRDCSTYRRVLILASALFRSQPVAHIREHGIEIEMPVGTLVT